MTILKFPRRPDPGVPAKTGASRWAIWKGKFREWAGRFLNRTGLPGAIQEATIEDGATGQTVNVRLGSLFTCITVNGRDYYFHRVSGRFDGTGSAVTASRRDDSLSGQVPG